MIVANYSRESTDQAVADQEIHPVLFFSLVFLFPRNAPMGGRSLMLLALTVIAVLSIYVLVTTRMR